MSKKLDATAITDELAEGSAFFRTARIYTEIILSLILQNNIELFTKYQQAAREEARAILFIGSSPKRT